MLGVGLSGRHHPQDGGRDSAQAKAAAFDMSDQQPASFGATVGQGEWGIFQDFLRKPTDIQGTAQALETAAAKAYKTGK